MRLDALTLGFLSERPTAAEGRWFDAGCGDGKGIGALVGRLYSGRLIGADAAAWGLRVVRREVPAMRGRIVRADARAWPYPDRVFDVVRAIHLLGHLDEKGRELAAAELHRLVRPGGHLLVGEFGTGDFRCGRGEEVAPRTFRRGVGIETHYFEGEELGTLLVSAGFQVTSIEPERFSVHYDGVERPRERWFVVAKRPQPGV